MTANRKLRESRVGAGWARVTLSTRSLAFWFSGFIAAAALSMAASGDWFRAIGLGCCSVMLIVYRRSL